ncbi:hypothetical protein [Thermus sp. NMX2.A1]|jgi:hypothetical protein|uniref:hypothetical protein n=1 Tax=Thermus sp. NMX2.A1 TaxID=570924 RepID=UPI0003DD837B|nr:hypothetical protein [Thermus sp. NMX2.A1]ETN88275.1 hypothetical protein TNMX_07695 [Thermus sp. NMX2.A1]
MGRIQPIARRFPLTTPIDDRSEWQSLPLEERLEAVWEMALFWAEREREKARREGREAEIATDRLLPVARKRPLPKP